MKVSSCDLANRTLFVLAVLFAGFVVSKSVDCVGAPDGVEEAVRDWRWQENLPRPGQQPTQLYSPTQPQGQGPATPDLSGLPRQEVAPPPPIPAETHQQPELTKPRISDPPRTRTGLIKPSIGGSVEQRTTAPARKSSSHDRGYSMPVKAAPARKPQPHAGPALAEPGGYSRQQEVPIPRQASAPSRGDLLIDDPDKQPMQPVKGLIKPRIGGPSRQEHQRVTPAPNPPQRRQPVVSRAEAAPMVTEPNYQAPRQMPQVRQNQQALVPPSSVEQTRPLQHPVIPSQVVAPPPQQYRPVGMIPQGQATAQQPPQYQQVSRIPPQPMAAPPPPAAVAPMPPQQMAAMPPQPAQMQPQQMATMQPQMPPPTPPAGLLKPQVRQETYAGESPERSRQLWRMMGAWD